MGCSASDQLLLDLGTSVKRKELRRLSRRQLRARLAELGAAKTEAQGLFHGELVDVVLLWNALWKLKSSMHAHDSVGQEEAVRALRHSGLPAHLLRKALLVVGIPWKDCCSLNGKEAEVLLNKKLVELIVRKAATNMISGTTFSLLFACFQGWKFAKTIPEAVDAKSGGLDGDAIFECLREESRRRDEEIGLMEQGRLEEASRLAEHSPSDVQEASHVLSLTGSQNEEDPAYWLDAEIENAEPCTPADIKVADRKLSPKAKAAPMSTTSVQTKKQRKSRDPNVSGAPKTPNTPLVRPQTPLARSDIAHVEQARAHTDPEQAAGLVNGVRNGKFEALDSELSTWLDEGGSEDAPLGLGKLR